VMKTTFLEARTIVTVVRDFRVSFNLAIGLMVCA
jgi:hypothetical protein